MKKKLLFAVYGIMVVGASVGAYVHQNKDAGSSDKDFFIENVEALSSDDAGGSGNACYNTIHDKAGCWVRYCPTCKSVPGTDAWYSIASSC